MAPVKYFVMTSEMTPTVGNYFLIHMYLKASSKPQQDTDKNKGGNGGKLGKMVSLLLAFLT